VRVASWVLVVCAAFAAIGVFLPSIELRVRGAVIKRADLSLYKAASDREAVRALLAAYRGSQHRKTAADVVRKVSPRVTGRARAALDDARDAMETLDDVSDADARHAGIALIAALVALLGLEAIAAALVFVEMMSGRFRRGRHAAALIAALLAAAVGVALHLVCREAVWQANDEVGMSALRLAPGAYVIPIAAIGALITAIALVRRRRTVIRAM
jgi:hypothetical protein